VGRSTSREARPVLAAVLGSVGEPINPEAWMWYHEHIGGERCPIVDTWWQTETGAMMISPLPGVTATKPGSATCGRCRASAPRSSTTTATRSAGRRRLPRAHQPWPSMLRGIWGDPQRYKDTYWSRWPQYYFAGDGAKLDEDGYDLAARPGRRRDERVGPPHLHHRGRVGAGRPPGRGRGGRRRGDRRDHRPGASSPSSSCAAAPS
jgi:acyl-coenzyme A synthetase/AMP-(fatty) acid ligase